MASSPALIASHPDRLLTALARDVPLVCGVVNVTPDSFSDGGRFLDRARAVDHGLSLVAEGTDLLDVGGESTRPRSTPPSVSDEIARVVPVVEALARHTSVPISVDTSRPEVMREAVAAGASMINDVRALRLPGALHAAADLRVPVCLMHMLGDPATMQDAPQYRDVVHEVRQFLLTRIDACHTAGIPSERILLDPGFGFGKTLTHNLELLSRLPEIADLGFPVMAGLSRKGMLGAITGRDVDHRQAASVAAAMIAAQNGAAILRVHDVAATVDAVSVLRALVYRGPASSSHAPNRDSAQ
ncbi:dihydropteroate synthase [Rhodococcus opacus]|uniref:Dihydropteroate synthase n=1 Tax=Rhodococcus opacus (strain B4) TaxID=632772 RepID=C1AXP5_RHOOB|nr:dihydropteroate synthase [Rhodococcus opacus]BAH49749.1 dihydropteroate synthase [Rhodococcus opacus B4]